MASLCQTDANGEEKEVNANAIREKHEDHYRDAHSNFIWAHFMNIGLAFWLLTAPFCWGMKAAQ